MSKNTNGHKEYYVIDAHGVEHLIDADSMSHEDGYVCLWYKHDTGHPANAYTNCEAKFFQPVVARVWKRN